MKYYSGKLPANIAKLYNEYMYTDTSVRKLLLMFNVFEHTLQYVSCILLSEYTREGMESNQNINGKLVALVRPTLGDWASFINTYSKPNNISEEDRFFKELSAVLSEIGNQQFEVLDPDLSEIVEEDPTTALIEFRNAIMHGPSFPDEDTSKEYLERYNPCLTAYLEAYSVLFNEYTLVRVEKVKKYNDEVSFRDLEFDIKFEEINASSAELIPNNNIVKIETSEAETLEAGNMCIIKGTFDEMENASDLEILKLSEFLIDIVDMDEDYMLYAGLRKTYVKYRGATARRSIEEYLYSIREKFIERNVSFCHGEKYFNVEAFTEDVATLTNFSLDQIKRSEKYVSEDLYINRSCDMYVQDFMNSDKTALFMKAEAGVGKTNFMCYTAEKYMKEGEAVFYFDARYARSTESQNQIFTSFQESLLDNKAFPTLIKFLNIFNRNNKGDLEHPQKKLVIIVDAVNEAVKPDLVLTEIDNMASLGKTYPWLKVIFSMRSVSYDIIYSNYTGKAGKAFPLFTEKERYFDVVREDEHNYFVEIEEWNLAEEMKAFENYKLYYIGDTVKDDLNFQTMSKPLKDMLRNPLNMMLFFKVKKESWSNEIKDENDLYEAFNAILLEDMMLKELPSKVQKFVVEGMFADRKNIQSLEKVDRYSDEIFEKTGIKMALATLTPYERLRDAGILGERETDDDCYVFFVYQKYLEHQLYRYILDHKMSDSEVVKLLIESRDLDELPELEIACRNVILSKPDAECMNLVKMFLEEINAQSVNVEECGKIIKDLVKSLITKVSEVSELSELIRKYDLTHFLRDVLHTLYISDEKDDAEKCIEVLSACKEDLTDEEIRYTLYVRALILQSYAECEKSIEVLNECIKRSSDDNENRKYQIQIAKNHRKNGYIKGAKDILIPLIKKYEEEEKAGIVNYDYYDDALIQLGLCEFGDVELSRRDDDDYRDYAHAQFDLAGVYYDRAHEISVKRNDQFTRLYNELGMSTLYGYSGDYQRAYELLLDIYRDTDEYGYFVYNVDCMNGLSANCVMRGEYERAIYWAEQGLVFWEDSRYYGGMITMYKHIMEALLGMGENCDKEKLRLYFEKAESVLPKIKENIMVNEHEAVKKRVMEYLESCR